MSWKDTHDDAIIFDWHNHATLKNFLFERGLNGKDSRFLAGLFKRGFWPFSERNTFPKIEEGGVDVLLSTSYVPEAEWAEDQSLIGWLKWLFPSVRKRIFDPTYFDATNTMMDLMEKEVEEYGGRFRFAKSLDQLVEGLENNDICLIHSIEGAHSLHGELCKQKMDEATALPQLIENEILTNLEHFWNRGVAYITLAHFYKNHIVSPVFPYPEYGIKRGNWKSLLARWDMNEGLTPIGKKVVQTMKDMGMLIDIGHCTPKARQQVYEIVGDDLSRVFSSHTGVFEINPDPYNLEDWELKWMADHNGLVGIIFMNYWIGSHDTGLGLKHIERTMNHVRNIAGDDILAIGTDFDGFTDPPDEMVDISELPRLTRYLSSLKNGINSDKYPPEVIKNILGGNSLRFILEGWKKGV